MNGYVRSKKCCKNPVLVDGDLSVAKTESMQQCRNTNVSL